MPESALGRRKADLATPALLADIDAVDRNIARIAAACRENGKAWRPHMKGLKIPALAHKAIAAGAVGITCAKLGEAEVMVAGGISDILIANQIVGADKLRRLAGLGRHARLLVAIDHPLQAVQLEEACRPLGTRLGVLIEVDIGLRRAGVPPGSAAAELARQIADLAHVQVRGVMGWEGHTCAVADLAAKEQAVASALGDLVRSAEACRAASAAADIVSCGGTGTYPISVRQAGVTEIQAGGGIFCDLRYRRKFGVELECALSVLATVSGRPNSRRIICDAGRKSMSDTLVLPAPVGIPAATSLTLSAEHAAIELAEPASTIQIGDKIEFIVGYVDGTVNLHDTLLGIRDGIVEVAWPVLARGRSD